MFSYLRPHHKRTPSNPTSPAEQAHSFEPPLHHAHPPRYQDAGQQDQSATSSPPFLPPIARVSSAESSLGGSRPGEYEADARAQNTNSSRNLARSRDTYGFSNHQRIPYVGTQRPESAGNAVPSNYTSSQFARPHTGMNQEQLSRPKPGEAGHSFVTASDLEKRPLQNGRRPNGARLPSPPPAPANNYATYVEPVQQRSGKTRLNLLNPMSLLARRRTSQAVTQLSPEALVSNRSGEKVFDPRIKGTVVHDFSAPRTRRNLSYNDVRTLDTTISNSRQFQRSPNGDLNATNETAATSPWSGGNHTPVFTENFEEEQYPAAGPHVRKASDLTDLPLPKPPYAKGAQKSVDSNSLSKSNEATQKQMQARRISARKPVPDIPPPVPPKGDGDLPQDSKRVSIDPSSTPPKASTTSLKKGRPRNVSDVSAKDAAIPKHMKSTSSRFSFDMIGAAEQERVLEDRHRKRALERKAEQDEDDRLEDDFEDNYDFDNMDDDDGLEERIPGVNADLEEEDYEERIPGVNTELEDDLDEMISDVNAGVQDDTEERIPGVNAESDDEDPYIFEEDVGNLAGFTFQQSSLPSPMSPASPGMVSTPRDANGEVIGFAMTKNSPHVPDRSSREPMIRPPSSSSQLGGHSSGVQGLGLEVEGLKLSPRPEKLNTKANEFPQPATLDDDDLYFDDGLIGLGGPGEFDDPVEFDESVFDQIDTDEYGRPLRSLSSLPTLYSPPMLTADPSPSFNKAVENATEGQDPLSPLSPGVQPPLVPQPSISTFHQPTPSAPSLTQDTLAAYQSALAEAAFTAAANGKFRRDSTPTNPTPSEFEDQHPGLVTDSSHTSHYEPFSPTYEIEDDFDYDDALEDDAIIAAANAEALANDCDGFYGQEFGFYSAPAASEAEYANGGYFGPRGVEGINRSQSGRVVSREPNLTPITERSEYSNRNSFMSFSMNGPGAIQSPGLAQLAGMLRSPIDYEGDMSLDALLKLRRGAWGGSQASLHSSNGSPRSAGGLEENSPVGQLPPWAQGGAVGNPATLGAGAHRRKNSGFSLGSEAPSGVGTGVQSESSSIPASPTMTMSMSHLDIVKEHEDHNDDSPPTKEEKEKGVRKHRYTGSAESISYLKEDDPVSGERWILERRRTGESGEIEFLGREVVSGGRI
ncbi:hypothetical protein L207DRAFT_517027 [Hyaloscypha variabilis F]|uniref:AGC-kinase C-terminal domain-containing protein n=1 Tax=Hyaloscypha variabilis (strain UAMH 11265 / GT02V1 / F) TaxID=1149755 RepID=A0A2J6R8Q2_HYAVF|nr:hypothetical protein L207DRAFT_517027 [Hyaloscypha variabilis F]